MMIKQQQEKQGISNNCKNNTGFIFLLNLFVLETGNQSM